MLCLVLFDKRSVLMVFNVVKRNDINRSFLWLNLFIVNENKKDKYVNV